MIKVCYVEFVLLSVEKLDYFIINLAAPSLKTTS